MSMGDMTGVKVEWQDRVLEYVRERKKRKRRMSRIQHAKTGINGYSSVMVNPF